MLIERKWVIAIPLDCYDREDWRVVQDSIDVNLPEVGADKKVDLCDLPLSSNGWLHV